jgi:hypothetical protein
MLAKFKSMAGLAADGGQTGLRDYLAAPAM